MKSEESGGDDRGKALCYIKRLDSGKLAKIILWRHETGKILYRTRKNLCNN